MGHLEDRKFMKIALKLSLSGLGFTEPNPLVGAVVVKDNRILASGFHRGYGGRHAEWEALKNITTADTTLYVTLEPCCHFGKTPPCTASIIDRRVKRVVTAAIDPNPLVNGQGLRQLQDHGLVVDVGLYEKMARKINRHYWTYMTRRLPYVTIHAGVSLDGKLTDKQRRSQWITDRHLRTFSHSLRGEFSAILVGVKTVLEDDPQLTIRQKGWGKKKLFRVVLDSRNKLDKSRRVFQDQARFPLVIFSAKEAKNQEKKVAHHFFVKTDADGLDLKEVLKKLYELQVASVLIEGGGQVIDSFLKKGLYDEFVLFVADKLIGGKEAVEIFPSGTGLDRPIIIKDKEIIPCGSGFVVRGYK